MRGCVTLRKIAPKLDFFLPEFCIQSGQVIHASSDIAAARICVCLWHSSILRYILAQARQGLRALEDLGRSARRGDLWSIIIILISFAGFFALIQVCFFRKKSCFHVIFIYIMCVFCACMKIHFIKSTCGCLFCMHACMYEFCVCMPVQFFWAFYLCGCMYKSSCQHKNTKQACMFMYSHVHTSTTKHACAAFDHMYTQAQRNTHVRSCIHMYTQAQRNTRVCACIHMYTQEQQNNVCIHADIRVYVQVFICTHICTFARMLMSRESHFVLKCIHTYIHRYFIHIYIHQHVHAFWWIGNLTLILRFSYKVPHIHKYSIHARARTHTHTHTPTQTYILTPGGARREIFTRNIMHMQISEPMYTYIHT